MRALELAELLRDGKASALEIVERLSKEAHDDYIHTSKLAAAYPEGSASYKRDQLLASLALERENAFELVISIFKASRMV